MASLPNAPPAASAEPGPLRRLGRFLASWKLALALIVVLAAVFAAATFLETAKGRDYVRWYVYGSHWLAGLLALLAANVLAASAIRFPWKKRRIGFLVAHAGVLVLLAGSIQALLTAVEGRVSLAVGETADSIVIADRSQLKARWKADDAEQVTEFSFRAGPVDWPHGKVLDFGFADGLGVRVLKFYRHAHCNVGWVADESPGGFPALHFELAGPDGVPIRKEWLPTEQFQTTLAVGPAVFQVHQAPAASMLEDFRDPPTGDPHAGDAARHGVLSMHYKDRMVRLAVHENMGKEIPVGDGGIRVEIVQYLPNAKAKPGAKVEFVSLGDEPRQPLLELQVHLPNEEKPLRQLAFAKRPLLTLDAVNGRRCPVTFWYHHPAIAPQPGVEFLQTPDGKLYCRVVKEGSYHWQGEVKRGDTIETAADFAVSILEYLPHARQETAFRSVQPAPDETPGPEAAALVEVTAGSVTREVWIQRNDPRYGFQRIFTPEGTLELDFSHEQIPLGYSLKMLDFTRGGDPEDQAEHASIAGSVQLVDPAQGIKQELEISMDRPLKLGKFNWRLSSRQQLADGKEVCLLTAATDPGRLLKHLGSALICLGAVVMFWLRARPAAKVPASTTEPRTVETDAPLPDDDHRQSPHRHTTPVSDRQAAPGYSRAA